ncbi:hypothetical protein [Pseudoduganella sp. OTU4001]|uniref:hypothetical protein n=1 Tax=Pseudoduganella sp. OTU4001 TaxID=3043854 RepID=UPI00313C024C
MERDMAAVAGTLPPVVEQAAPQPAVALVPAPAPAPEPAPAPAAAEASAPAPDIAPNAVPAPPPRVAARPAPRLRAASVAKQNATPSRKAMARVKAKAPNRRKLAREPLLYWEVFKRCPLPGEPGAVECRRHICNGAESEGPACKPYRRRWR